MNLSGSGDRAASAAIQVLGVSKVFGAGAEAVRALDDVSIDIRQNEFFTLLGPSGCGKTTLLRLIGGFEQPTAGEISLEGQPLAHLPPFRRPINTVFQSYALFPHLSVADNIGFGLEMLGWPAAKRRKRIEEMLALVKLSGFERRKPAQLSGGQQQRVALARALASAPRVLLLDEPLSALDLKLRKEMQLELKRLQLETGITFIFVTHDQEEALTMSDRLAVMRDGEILQVGTPAEIYEHPVRRFVADFIGEINFLEGGVAEVDSDRAIVQLEAGGRLPVPATAVAGRQEVTLAVRPERVGLTPGSPVGSSVDGALAGRIDNIVYFGTDTIYHVRIAGAADFKVRVQNREGPSAGLAVGDAVAVTIPPAAAQVLAD